MSCNQKTVKILSLDGGGIRGYFQATFLKRFCQEAGIDPSKLFEYFDIICGTSIGGIQAIGYASGLTPDFMLNFFEDYGEDIFTKSTVVPGYQFNVMMGFAGWPDPDSPSDNPTTMYKRDALRTAIESAIGPTVTMSQLGGKVIIPAWDVDESKQTLFSNINGVFNSEGDPYFVGYNNKAVDVALCTSAAPVYFPSMKGVDLNDGTGPHDFSDGGVYCNNPGISAYFASKILYPTSTRFCILSVGTGLAKNPLSYDSLIAPYNVQLLTYYTDNVFIPGPQEFNNQLLYLGNKDVFNDVFYYRFNYAFKNGEDPSLDNASPANLIALASYANNEYDIEQQQISEFIEHLNAQ
jgi:patatin-like phospholipase/acyl hydrolase